jgi:hypothetical protein
VPERVAGGEGEQIEISIETQVREAIFEEKDIRLLWESLESVQSGLIAIRADENADPGKLTGKKHGLVAGNSRAEERSIASTDDANPSPLSLVAARQDRHIATNGRQMSSNRSHERGLSCPPPMKIADADDDAREPGRPASIPPAAQVVCRGVEQLPR